MLRKDTYLPTYDEAVMFTNRGDLNKGKLEVFYENKYTIDGFNVSVFNYRLSQYTDFIEPMGKDYDNSKLNAYEMRGLTFVFNLDGSLYKRYILLDKFFNLNQVEETQYGEVKDYEIVDSYLKEDGSVVTFIELPNKNVVPKTKIGFTNDQCEIVKSLYDENENIQEFVGYFLGKDIIPVFEFVSPKNRIVIKYNKSDLILLKLRCNKTGQYIDLDGYSDIIKKYSIRVTPKMDTSLSLDNYIEQSITKEGIEGWVLTLKDKESNKCMMIKVKTEWYKNLHGIFTDDLYREHVLIKHILNDEIDDFIGALPEDEINGRKKIDKIIDIIYNWIDEKSREINELYDKANGLSDKEVAIKYNKYKNFTYVMSIRNGYGDSYEYAKMYIQKRTSKLKMAREALEERGYKEELV